MHGRIRPLVGALGLLVLMGCADEEPPAAPPEEPGLATAGTQFDPANTGSVEGRVVWQGPVPEVPPFPVYFAPENLPPDGKRVGREPNPFRPLVDSDGGGVQAGVVFLRGIDPAWARPWPHDRVCVEQRGRQIRVVQGGQAGRVGFVRRGDLIEVVNRDPEYHALRARGAAFFSLPFVDADRPSTRRLDQSGLVWLSSGAGYFWMQAHLLVDDQPYYARTDRAGRFRLEQVPAGRYEAVCWLPSWVVTKREREPENGLVSRIRFAPPAEQTAHVEVRAGATGVLHFVWTTEKVVGVPAR
jgi:hypothetical protein